MNINHLIWWDMIIEWIVTILSILNEHAFDD
jgi:hypothetical protein